MQEIPSKTTGDTYTANEFTFGVKSELQSIVSNTGQSFSGANQAQLMQGLMRLAGSGQFYQDTGAVNAYIVNLSAGFSNKAISAYNDGLMVNFFPVATNTGIATLQIGSLPSTPIVDEKGNPLVQGEIRLNQPVSVVYTSNTFKLLRPVNTPKIIARLNGIGTLLGIPTGIIQANITAGPLFAAGQAEWLDITFPTPFSNNNYFVNLALADDDAAACMPCTDAEGGNLLTTKVRIVMPPIIDGASPRVPGTGIYVSIRENE